MSSELEKIIVTMEANNAALLKEIDRTNNKIKQFEGGTKKSLEKVDRSFKKTSKQVGQFSNGFKSMRGATTQLGFQMQDIAVQLQAGTSAAVVFGQQGSQIASIFGPGGAVIGALIAVGAALGGALLPRLFKSTDATKELEKAVEELNKTLKKGERGIFEFTKEFKLLAEKNKDIALVRVGREQDRALEAGKLALSELKKELKDVSAFSNKFNLPINDLGELVRILNKPLTTKEDLIKISGILNQISLSSANSSPEVRKLADDVNKAVLQLKDMEAILAKLKNASVNLDFSSIADLKKSTAERIKLINKMVGASSKELDAFIKQVQQQEKADAAFNNLVQGAMAQAFPDEARIRKLNEQILTLEAAAEQSFDQGKLQDVQKYQEAIAQLEGQISKTGTELNRWQDEALKNLQGSFGDFFADMDSGFEGIGDTFLRMINRMIANAASAQLMKYLFGSEGTGGLLSGAGGGIMDTIGKGLFGFDGGGFTGNAPRSGGMDGKGGFLAMMHPQEIVTDLKGSAGAESSSPVNVAVVYDADSVLEIMKSPAGRKVLVESSRKDARQINRNLSRV